MQKFIFAGVGILIIGLVWFFFFSSPPYTTTFTGEHILGAENGSVKVVMYSDFLCPYCKSADAVMKKILEDYPNDVSLVYKHMVVHDAAMPLAIASECAGDQEKFWDMHDKIFENQKRVEYMSMADLAESLGVDKEKFSLCIRSGVMRSRVATDMKEAASVGVKATPSFTINGKFLEGILPYDQMKKLIEQNIRK